MRLWGNRLDRRPDLPDLPDLPRSVSVGARMLGLIAGAAAIASALALVIAILVLGRGGWHSVLPAVAAALLGGGSLLAERTARRLRQRSRRWAGVAFAIFAVVAAPGLHDAVVGPGRIGTLIPLVVSGVGTLALLLPSARAWAGQREARTSPE